jgi:hypothetical protein
MTDIAKIADSQRRIQELEAMMDRLLNPTNTPVKSLVGSGRGMCAEKLELTSLQSPSTSSKSPFLVTPWSRSFASSPIF